MAVLGREGRPSSSSVKCRTLYGTFDVLSILRTVVAAW